MISAQQTIFLCVLSILALLFLCIIASICHSFYQIKKHNIQVDINIINLMRFVDLCPDKPKQDATDTENGKTNNKHGLLGYETSGGMLCVILIGSLIQFIVCIVLFAINIDKNDNRHKNSSCIINFEFLSINLIISILISFYMLSHIIYSYFIISQSTERCFLLNVIKMVRTIIVINIILTVALFIILCIFITATLILNSTNETKLIIDILNAIHLIYVILLVVAFIVCLYYCIKCINVVRASQKHIRIKLQESEA